MLIYFLIMYFQFVGNIDQGKDTGAGATTINITDE